MAKRPDLVARNTKHGLLNDHAKTYRVWKDMRQRCLNPKNASYADYGGRGIGICARWDDFAAFLGDMGDRPDGMSLDRLDVNGGYEPSNCRWATDVEQAGNRRSSRLIEWRGECKPLQQWCREFGIEHSKVRYRLKAGWPLDLAFSSVDGRL